MYLNRQLKGFKHLLKLFNDHLDISNFRIQQLKNGKTQNFTTKSLNFGNSGWPAQAIVSCLSEEMDLANNLVQSPKSCVTELCRSAKVSKF